LRTGFAGRRPILQKAESEKGTPMKAVCGTIFALAAFILFAFGGDSKHQLIGSGAVPLSFTNCGPAGNGFPCMFWGVQVHDLSSYPLQVPYGQFRGWDGANANWPAIAANCNPSSPPNAQRRMMIRTTSKTITTVPLAMYTPRPPLNDARSVALASRAA